MLWFVLIAYQGVGLTEVGPFYFYSSCSEMKRVIEKDFERAFDKHFQRGMSLDMWDMPYIATLDDVSFTCVDKKLQIK